MSRPKSPPGRRSVSKPVSLFPSHIRHANKRATAASISLSRYIQSLIEYDLANDILGRALTAKLDGKKEVQS